MRIKIHHIIFLCTFGAIFFAAPEFAYANFECGQKWQTSICEKDKFEQQEEIKQQEEDVKKNLINALKSMTSEFVAVMMHQATAAGMFFDASEQNDSMRHIEELKARAHKDYHPSEQMCYVGSFMKGVAQSEDRARQTKRELSQNLLAYALNAKDTESAGGKKEDYGNRTRAFFNTYCDTDIKGLTQCRTNDKSRANRDVDYISGFYSPLTLEMDKEDGQDLEVLARNLYWPKVLRLNNVRDNKNSYMRIRQLIAKNSVAYNSLTTIAGMKAAVTQKDSQESGTAFIKAMIKEINPEEDVDALLGKNPSYYAQMDVLAKTLYQNPSFYTNLHDKPANIERINVALEALQRMHYHDRFDSQLRREMLFSQLLEDVLAQRTRDLSVD